MKGLSGKVGAIIVAAGTSSRMGGIDKVFATLDGEPLLATVIAVFQNCSAIDKIVVVLARRSLGQGRKLVKDYGWSKVIAICPGGQRRQDSVREGLQRLTDCEWVVIHDGARPCIDTDLIERGLMAARESGAAIAGVPVKDTIKIVSRRRFIQQTPARQSLWAAQTPQVFRYDLIQEAYHHVNNEATDDATLVEQLGYKVEVYMGSYNNIKVTTPDDLAIAKLFIQINGRSSVNSGESCASVSATMPTR
ncbi:MAG: 2-C-methyl-D-erythritol 4-phosphate cytidylyltransferase [Dehalococcoidia bacterium]|nr:MAG: 2-C-methyl-D-erythritol 4-phosphate cytidylyltransferase [Dehalococcoidia bacterium]